MCIVIDTNTFSSVFSSNSVDHQEFSPVLKWIKEGKGKIVFGGTKYKQELESTPKYLRLFRQFKAARKTVEVSDEAVDREQKRIEKLIDHRDFDDPHLVAIVAISRCKLICSKDSRADPFIRDLSLYPKNVRRPSIYRSSTHSHLLCDRNLANCCKAT